MEGNQNDLIALEEEEELVEKVLQEHFRADIDTQDTPIEPAELITIHKRRNTTLPAIEIRDGFKNYGYFTHWRQVLKGCNLKANNGEIYAILGPHASGKTTILHLLLGLTRLNHGEVEIFGYNPRNPLCGIPGIRVGFAPQREGLYLEFSIDEILRYYASILRLSNEYLNHRISFLTNFLSLPTEKHILKLYDDNIRRRVSFAIAILHEPQLLILDEPTRGINPAIRNSIWNHLLFLSNEKDTTIIVATANSIEAEFSHRVGLLREGRIIVEGRPKTILDRSTEKSLDALYTRLYSRKLDKFDTVVDNVMKQAIIITPEISEFKQTASEGFDITSISLREISRPKVETKLKKYVSKYDKCKIFLGIQRPKCYKIVSVSKKNLLVIARNLSWSVYFLLVTLSLLVLFYYGIGHEPRKLPVGLYSGEIKESDECKTIYYSCQILFRIDTNIIEFIKFNDERSLLESARNGELSGYILFPKDFTQSVRQELASDLFAGELKPLADLAFIKISLDLSNVINAFEIEKEIRRAEVDFFNKVDLNEEASLAADYPLKFMEPLFGTKNTTYSEYVGTSLVVCWPVSISFTIVVAFYMTERERKLHQMSYLIGKFLI
ncbi:ABC transporter G family member 23-like [Chrysoperla carnea]|uniref:ABC transporter G family member 23-like n=1 Tax=Chrysoperla carnea TaxID=189513 RepID=UPI001D078773|nr:ABC transporter G family member 23-like [Chrysoperla carnea]